MLAEQEATWRRLRAGLPVGDDELKWFRIRESHPLWQARAAELIAASRRAVGDD